MIVFRVIRFIFRLIRQIFQRVSDVFNPTYSKTEIESGLLSYSSRWVNYLKDTKYMCPKTLAGITSLYCDHFFDILGSGWVQVKYGLTCRGMEEYTYNVGKTVHVDKSGKWLYGRINRGNLKISREIWSLVDLEYEPIDWQLMILNQVIDGMKVKEQKISILGSI